MTTRRGLRGGLKAPNVQRRPTLPVRRAFLTMVTTTTATGLISPILGDSMRLHRVWVVVETAETADKVLELYWGLGASAAADINKVVDMLTIKAVGTSSTRTYDALAADQNPTGLPDEQLTYRWRSAPTNAHLIFVEFRRIPSHRIRRNR